VFPLAEAGNFFNKHFVCVEFDMEKGEGPDIAKKYGVRAYPTFLILDANGTERYRVVGASELDSFIPRVRRGMDPKNSLAVLAKEYASGKMKKERKLTYLFALQDANDGQTAGKIKKELLASLTPAEKLSATYWPLLDKSTETLDFIVKNQAKLEKSVGKEKVSHYLNESYITLLNDYVSKGVKTEAGEKLRVAINDRVSRGELVPDVVLEIKLACAGELSSGGNFVPVVDLLAKNVETLSMTDLLGFTFVFRKLDMKNKALMTKVVAICDAIIGKLPSENRAVLEDTLEKHFAPYKKAAATGVYWEHLTLAEALAKAKREGKYVFMDCYTTWCGPCAYMANTVFPRPEVGDYFNEHFINVKYDMEEGEGIEIAKKYNVYAFPMFILLNPDGSVQHKTFGSSEKIVEEVKKGLTDEHATGALDRKYAGGNRDKEFLSAYLEQLIDFYEMDKAREVHGILDPLLSDAERTSKRYWYLYESNEFSGDGSATLNYLLAHKKAFEASVGKDAVDEKITELYKRRLYPVLLGKETPGPGVLEKLKKELAPYKLTREKELFACIDLVSGYAADDPGKLLKVATKKLDYLTEENADIAIFTLNYLKKNTTGKLDALKKMAGKLAKRFTLEEYKEILSRLFEEQGEEQDAGTTGE
jgi:thiol-disulfide isomerase/thioredoxin